MQNIALSPLTPAAPNAQTSAASTDQAEAPSMHALLQFAYGGSEVLQLGTRTRPTPGAHEVLVKVHAAGIDRGTWHLMTGRPYLMRLMGFGFRAPKNPVAGLDLAGTVLEVGAKVTRFRAGDRVFGIGQGTFAEYTCALESKLAVLPAGFSFEQAAVLGVSGITALQALDAGHLKPGERVLVVGASGGVGSYAVQLAKALGAEVTGVCSTTKVPAVRALGADHVVDYRTQNYTDGSSQYDLILDIGGNTPLKRLRRAMTETARLVFVGGENGGDWSAGFGRQLQALVLGLFVKQRFVMLMSQEHRDFLERLVPFCESGQLKPVIDREIGLAEVPSALSDLEAGRVCGKIAVRIVSESSAS
jgi:NADPH:quinone reductase-like Zn-dependent oxidoreductase